MKRWKRGVQGSGRERQGMRGGGGLLERMMNDFLDGFILFLCIDIMYCNRKRVG